MIISHKYQFIYIKCPKTAGTSTEIFLEALCDENDIVTGIWPIDFENNHHSRNCDGFYNHIRPREIKAKIGDKIFNEYFKFCNIRNPWDRCVSSYFWNLKDGHKSFNDWFDGHEFPSLWSFYAIQNTSIMDDYIRYENLTEDIHRILKKLQIPYDQNKEIPKTKVGRENKEYRSFFNQERKDKIARICNDEIDRFGYEF